MSNDNTSPEMLVEDAILADDDLVAKIKASAAEPGVTMTPDAFLEWLASR